jgi:hypothetical protein
MIIVKCTSVRENTQTKRALLLERDYPNSLYNKNSASANSEIAKIKKGYIPMIKVN